MSTNMSPLICSCSSSAVIRIPLSCLTVSSLRFAQGQALSEAKDLVLIGYGHAPRHSSLKSRQSGLTDSIKATFFARTQPFICFSRAIAAFTSDVSSK
jgi:hypothetical protein